MKKSRKPLQATGLILAGLVCFLAIPLLAGSQAWAASPAGPTMLAQAAPAKGPSTQGAIKAPTAISVGSLADNALCGCRSTQ